MPNTIKFVAFLLLILVSLGCKDKSEINPTIEPVDIHENNTPSSFLEVGCYIFKKDKNSIMFKITHIDYSIKGKLDYRLAEKDANTGTFEGFLIDDVILGDYTFQSEGITSKREVIFKIVNGQLIEGFGPMDEDGICFVNTDHITYTPTMPLSKTKCPK